MDNANQPIQTLSELAQVLLQKLKEAQTDITLDFQDVQLQGPGPQGQPGQWRLNGKLALNSKSKPSEKS